MAKITIQNMAKDLGLSRNTVALALKGDPLVTRKTRDIVLRHAVKVGYLAQMPASEDDFAGPKAERHIMILRKPEEAFYWDRVINGITGEASRHNCQTHVAVVSPEEEREGVFPPGLNERIDAVFFMKMMDLNYVWKVKEKGYLIFMLDAYQNYCQEPIGDVVRVDGRNAVKYLTESLIGQGMSRIAFLNENSSTYETMHDRYAGYTEAMTEAGLALPSGLVMPDMESETFYYDESFDELVSGLRELPEAVVCGNDVIAMKLTQALRKRRIRVPEDVAVTGFDDDEAGRIDPFFSTVQIDGKYLGKRLVQSFIWRLDNPGAPPEKILVNARPVIRVSSVKRK